MSDIYAVTAAVDFAKLSDFTLDIDHTHSATRLF